MAHHLCIYRWLRVNATNYNQNHTRTHQSPMPLKFKFYVHIVEVVGARGIHDKIGKSAIAGSRVQLKSFRHRVHVE